MAEFLKLRANSRELHADQRVALAATAQIVNRVRRLESADLMGETLPVGEVIELPVVGIQSMASLEMRRGAAAINTVLYMEKIMPLVGDEGIRVNTFAARRPRLPGCCESRAGLDFLSFPVGDYSDQVVLLRYGDRDRDQQPYHTRAFLLPSFGHTISLYNSEADKLAA